MREYTQTTQSSGIHDDALTHVLGPEHRGRVRGLGFGVTLRKMNAQNDASRKYERTIEDLQQKLQMQEQRQEQVNQQMQEKLQNVLQQMGLLQSTWAQNAPRQVSPTENVVGSLCELLHYNGTGLVVAKGEVDSTDPNALIGEAPLGSECWNVWITDVNEENVPLYRAQSPYCVLKDVIGLTIAWPIKFVKICGLD